jgi:hypothetical protein
MDLAKAVIMVFYNLIDKKDKKKKARCGSSFRIISVIKKELKLQLTTTTLSSSTNGPIMLLLKSTSDVEAWLTDKWAAASNTQAEVFLANLKAEICKN